MQKRVTYYQTQQNKQSVGRLVSVTSRLTTECFGRPMASIEFVLAESGLKLLISRFRKELVAVRL